MHVSSTSGRSSILKGTLRDTFKSASLTRDELCRLMKQFPQDVADGSYADKACPHAMICLSCGALPALLSLGVS